MATARFLMTTSPSLAFGISAERIRNGWPTPSSHAAWLMDPILELQTADFASMSERLPTVLTACSHETFSMQVRYL